ncbi:MAG TPA: hypothetical protein VFU21_23275, partial [Kofleriaceae bacterium]|nr:hypothetical protein [Kofleriaceae bacterium]
DLPRTDGGPPDATPIDAENLCPGAVTFEAFAGNLESGAAEFEVELSEVADPGNSATSAPNGRIVLCLPDADSDLRAEKTDYLSRVDAVPGAVAAHFDPEGIAYPLHVISQAAAETLYTDLGTTLMAPDAQVVVSVIEVPAGTPLEGATVEIDKADTGQFARDETGSFAAGNQVAGGGLVLFANVPLAGGDVEVTVTPPDGFRGTCTGPATLPLTAGEMSGAVFACQ